MSVRLAPIRVTYFSDAPVYGGGERYLELLATGFARKAVTPEVVLATEPEMDALAARLSAKDIAVTRLPRVPTLSAVGPFLKVLRHVAWRRPQIIHFNLVDPRACNGAIVAAKLAGYRNLVTTEHLPHSPFDDLPTPLRHQVAMAVVRQHIVVSRASRDALLSRKLPPDRVTVVHNGIALPPDPGVSARAAARAELWPDLPVGSNGLIGFAARLSAQKQPQLFVEAMAEVATRLPTARFVVLGDGEDRRALEVRAKALGLGDRIRFLGHRPDARELFCGLDVLVMTSRYEGLPLTVLEAMSVGVPVVAPRIQGIDEAVEHGVTGLLFDPDSVAPLVSDVESLLVDPVRRADLGRAARARVAAEFSLDSMLAKTLEVYERMVPA